MVSYLGREKKIPTATNALNTGWDAPTLYKSKLNETIINCLLSLGLPDRKETLACCNVAVQALGLVCGHLHRLCPRWRSHGGSHGFVRWGWQGVLPFFFPSFPPFYLVKILCWDQRDILTNPRHIP